MCVCQSDEDYGTYDTVLELDEVLNLDTDDERAAYIQVTSPISPVLAVLPVLDWMSFYLITCSCCSC